MLTIEKISQPHQYERQRNDVETWLAEMLDGPLYRPDEFDFSEGDIISSDGRPMRKVYEQALLHTELRANRDPRFKEELERTRYEHLEYLNILAMARGDGPNTLVTIWEIPEYVLANGADIGGYRFKKRRAMMRVTTRLTSGKIRIETQSLDGGLRAGFESIYDALDVEAQEGFLYKQPIKKDLPPEKQDSLCPDLKTRYEQAYYLKTGLQTVAGASDPTTETMSFVRDQSDLTDAFVRKYMNRHMNDIPESELISIGAAIRRRYEGRAVTGLSAEAEMGGAGAEAIASGEVFSACGDTIGGKSAISNEQRLQNVGFSILTTMMCPVCGGKAMGYACGDAWCLDDKGDCGSELKDGKVINRFDPSRPQKLGKGAIESLVAYWRSL